MPTLQSFIRGLPFLPVPSLGHRLTVLPRARTKRGATLRDILRMIPTERPARQMAGMLRHLRATPGQDYFEMKTAPRAS